MNGIGKYHLTSIFPILIYQVKDGINLKPTDPNYDLRLLAMQVAQKRMTPNFVNCDSPIYANSMTNADTYPTTMGA